MQNKINLGIIGKNFGYNVIYKSFLKNKKYNIKGFSFKSKAVGKIKIPKKIKIYNDWKKLILNKKIKAIAIATPPILHKKIISPEEFINVKCDLLIIMLPGNYAEQVVRFVEENQITCKVIVFEDKALLN